MTVWKRGQIGFDTIVSLSVGSSFNIYMVEMSQPTWKVNFHHFIQVPIRNHYQMVHHSFKIVMPDSQTQVHP
jgi:hypothetical protein